MRGIEDNSKIIFLISKRKHFLNENIYCDPTLEEPTRQDDSNDGLQHMY